MKILFTIDKKSFTNPFAITIINAIQALDENIIIDCCKDCLWLDKIYEYDIIHVMWPEFLVSNSRSAIDLYNRLSIIKNKGIKIVSTCHNLFPHYCQDIQRHDAIKYSYEISDSIHHMGIQSMSYLAAILPRVRHELIPHHIYDQYYQHLPSREEACRHLGLSAEYDYILSLGAIRDVSEVELIEFVVKNLGPSTKLIAPSLVYNIGGRLDLFTRLKYYRKKYLINRNRLISNIGVIDDNELPYYLAVSSVSLIQRVKILNSGNLPLGFYAGNVVVGPKVGNVGQILQDTGNYVFSDIAEIPDLIESAITAYKQGQGSINNKIATENWSSSIIASKIISSYYSL